MRPLRGSQIQNPRPTLSPGGPRHALSRAPPATPGRRESSMLYPQSSQGDTRYLQQQANIHTRSHYHNYLAQEFLGRGLSNLASPAGDKLPARPVCEFQEFIEETK
ncbi:hypothetical protein RRG08_021073 [Elysia crispata]|uniref:Uncharacterized protein n=1 Tax=Elysia crispata TaxID=231223 RepID=A0AAE1AJH9_9GAST|nr:hypothetical protein RRG08_021073 [Elysia crispata]